MKYTSSFQKTSLFVTFLLLFLSITSKAQTLPYEFKNNSPFSDNSIYVAVIGIINDNHVWVDCKTSTINPMLLTDNTVLGPIYGGNKGPGANAMYANCFTKLSDLPNKTINLPRIAGCRILISVDQQLYLYFFGNNGGYAAPNLASTSDPNQGIRFEMIELTWAPNGLWTNTTRVDSYQFPMGLEVWGNNNFYKKVGELKSHEDIVNDWKTNAPAQFQGCLDADGIIKFPSKIAAFQAGGTNANYFKPYVDSIWSKFTKMDMAFNLGNEGSWKGRVIGEQFNFTRPSDGATAVITRRPTNQEVMEGSGVMASGSRLDLVLQAQICAAINRHAIDLTVANGVQPDWSDDTKYYQTPLYNWYCKFWHQPDISFEKFSYAFCYDDVFDKSSTVNCPSPTKVLITFGGFAAPVNTNSLIVNVANDTVIKLPVNSLTLKGTGSDSNGLDVTFAWTQFAGPNTTTFVTPNLANTLVNGLIEGTYIYRLTVSNGLLFRIADIKVVVEPGDNTVGANIALNKAVTASSFQAGNEAAKINDGKTDTRWAPSTNTYPQWTEIDLGAEYNLTKFQIRPYSNRDYQYLVEVKTNVGAYKVVVDRSNNTESAAVLVDNVAALGRYIRVTITGAATYAGGWGTLYEIEAFGSLASLSSVVQPEMNAINIFPNPSTGFINLNGFTQAGMLEIYNMTGQLVKTESIKEICSIQLNLSNLKPGVYVVKYTNNTAIYLGRFMLK